MDLEKMQAEMAKYQAEMLKIQAKYANPTPENITKMQKEMLAINQKITELSMQYASAAASGGMNFDQPDFDNDDDEDMLQFIKEHPAPKDKAKYLPLGALLLCTNGEPYETFALAGETDDWLEALEDSWGFEDAEDGKKMLASLIKGRHEGKFGEDYRKLKAGKTHKLDEDSVEAYNETLENLAEDLPSLLPYAKKCETLIAWDLERVCYLSRIFVHLGWMAEADAFKWMEKAAAKVKETFSKWEEYAASILMGRAVAMGFGYQVIGAASELFEEKKAFLKSHPISAL